MKFVPPVFRKFHRMTIGWGGQKRNKIYEVRGVDVAGKGERDQSGWEKPGVAMETGSYQLSDFSTAPPIPFQFFHLSITSSHPQSFFLSPPFRLSSPVFLTMSHFYSSRSPPPHPDFSPPHPLIPPLASFPPTSLVFSPPVFRRLRLNPNSGKSPEEEAERKRIPNVFWLE